MSIVIQEEQPLISVIMCAYNVRSYIEQAVSSILEQTHTNYELIIGDDGSTDGTREWLKKLESHPKVKLFFHERNIGYVANKNFLISQASGEYITQNDSDDLSDLSRLEKQIEVCSRNRNIRIVACGFHKVDQNGKVYDTIRPKNDLILNEYNGEAYPFWFPPLLVHREVYARNGLYSDFFAGIGDDLYWTVRANEQFDIYCLNDVLYSYRNNPNSITNVLDNGRKLIVGKLLSTILNQRRLTGSDFLEQGNKAALISLEQDLLSNKKVMAEQYRIWAAKAVDQRNWEQSKQLLKTSLAYNVFNNNWYRTFLYYLRRRYKLNFKNKS